MSYVLQATKNAAGKIPEIGGWSFQWLGEERGKG
jgi:hypothetical protein